MGAAGPGVAVLLYPGAILPHPGDRRGAERDARRSRESGDFVSGDEGRCGGEHASGPVG